MAGYDYWRKRQSALMAMEPLMVHLVADDPLIKSEEGEETGDDQGPQSPTLLPAVRLRSARTTTAVAPTATSSANGTLLTGSTKIFILTLARLACSRRPTGCGRTRHTETRPVQTTTRGRRAARVIRPRAEAASTAPHSYATSAV